MIELKKGPTIICKNCNKEHVINVSDFEDISSHKEERSMGYEIEYYWKTEFDCDSCKNNIEIEIAGYEYPIGFMNFENIENKGCSVKITPILELVTNPEL